MQVINGIAHTIIDDIWRNISLHVIVQLDSLTYTFASKPNYINFDYDVIVTGRRKRFQVGGAEFFLSPLLNKKQYQGYKTCQNSANHKSISENTRLNSALELDCSAHHIFYFIDTAFNRNATDPSSGRHVQ